MEIHPLALEHLEQLKLFTDQTIGENYFTSDELREAFEKSQLNGVMCSFVLVDDQEKIHGFRLAYPPTTWSKGKGSQLSPELWQEPLEKVAYFQSLFLDDKARGKKWGPELSEHSIKAFRKLGARAVVTHAWKESPQNSSLRYLEKFGFQPVIEYPNYWINVDYTCVRDGKPCRCTAVEMIKYLTGELP